MKSAALGILYLILCFGISAEASPNRCHDKLVELSRADIESLNRFRALVVEGQEKNPFDQLVSHLGFNYELAEFLGSGKEGHVAHVLNSIESFTIKRWKNANLGISGHKMLEDFHHLGIPTIFLSSEDLDLASLQSRFRFVRGLPPNEFIWSYDVSIDTKMRISSGYKVWAEEAAQISGRRFFDRNVLFEFNTGKFFLNDGL